ncbi:hypothetical protein ACGFNU_18460 [Spirillospora sp. NPDC048911]|uniref:hypothetical protein n=1 Tax=Spirillospora sp. NPDC048911 TaxID=3364527 RepID=UPI00371B5DD4
MTTTTSGHAAWTDAPPATPARTRVGSLLRRWPVVAGIAMAAFTAYDMSAADLAPILTASGLVYLGAAALGRRSATWPVFLGAFVIVAATPDLGVGIDATWILLGLAGVFVGYGLLRGATRPADGLPLDGLPLQTLAMAGAGAIAAVSLFAGDEIGGYLVAAGLLGHAAWDVWHHRTGKVVARSLAEFCFVIDTLLAVAMVVIAVRS